MNKRLCICGFIIGGLLLLAAALLIVTADAPRGSISATQRLRLETLASDTGGCLTCHAAPVQAEAGQIALVARPLIAHDHIALTLHTDIHTAPDAAPSVLLPTAAQDDIRTMAQRILDLSDQDAVPVRDTATAFLAEVDALHAASSADEVTHVLARLAQIDETLRALEHRAQPVKWTTPDTTDPVPDVLAVVPLLQVPAPAAVVSAVPIIAPCTGVCDRVSAALAAHNPAACVYDVQRRGPPALADNRIVVGRRLPFPAFAGEQSSFIVSTVGKTV